MKLCISYKGACLALFLGISALAMGQEPAPAAITVADTIPDEVSIAYSKQPRWKVVQSVSQVKGNELQKYFSSNLGNALLGRLSGLTATQGSGEPGSDAPGLYARGVGTFGSGQAPLIIVDGSECPFNQITPEEVESVTLLKDAATAIFGLRGANGVLQITTKRGQSGRLKVNFGIQQGFNSALRLPQFLDSYDYARLYNEALSNDGKAALYSQQDLEAYRTGSDPYFHPNVNWYNHVLRNTAPIGNYNLNLSGGNKTVRYFVLLNAIKNNGLYRKMADESENSTNSSYTRYNFRTNIDVNITKRLVATLLLGGTVEDKANPAARGTAGMFNTLASIPPNAFPVYNPNGSYGGNAIFTNPLGDILESGFYTSNGRTLQSTFKLSHDLDMITPGLSATASVSFNSYFRSYSDKSRQYQRFSISKTASGDTVYNSFGQKTSLVGNESQSDQWRNVTIQAFLNYNRSFGSHDIDAMLMFNSDDYIISGNNIAYQHKGTGGRITYANNKKYIAEFSFGYNGSENFMDGKNYGFFPAGSIGWILSNERFLKNNTVLTHLKLRASYGLTGNDAIGGSRFMFRQFYYWSTPYYLGNSNSERGGIVEGALANTNVTWEKDKKMNISMEATLFKNLDLSVDVFSNKRYDILTQPYQDLPQYLGIPMPSMNLGKVNNKGFEATVKYTSNAERKVRYYVAADVWYASNKIISNSEALQVNNYLYRSGQQVGQPYVLEAIGLFRNQAEIDNSPRQTFATVRPGDIRYKDQNGDNIIDQNDYYPIGNTWLPKLTTGLRAGIEWRGFDLSVFFQGVTNRTVYLSGNYFHAFQNNASISTVALNRWTPETAATADYPRLSANNNLNNYQPSSFWQRNGSFIKMRYAELGYTLIPDLSRKLKVDNVRIFVNGTNLFSIDHIKFTDPETLTGYPAVRTISAGARIQF